MDTKADLLIGAYEVWEFTNKLNLLVAYFAGAGTYAGTYHAWADYIFRRACYKDFNDNREYVPVGNFEKRIRKSFKSDSDEEFFNEATDALCEIASGFIESYGLSYWVHNEEDDDSRVVASVSVSRFVPGQYLVLSDDFSQDDLAEGYQVYQ